MKKETIVVCSENHTEFKNALCGGEIKKGESFEC
jgi:hypothetical protein